MAERHGHYIDRSQMTVPLVPRNYWLAIANGSVVHIGVRMLDPMTVVSLLVLRLSGLNWVIGLTTALMQSAYVAVQMVASRYLDTIPRKRPIYVIATFIRVGALVMAGLALISGEGMHLILLLLLLELALFLLQAGMGMANLVWSDVVAKSVPSTKRGSMVMYRLVGGLVLSQLIAVPLVRYLLGPESGLDFPIGYGYLFLLSGVFRAVAWVMFFFIDEPPSKTQRHRLTFAQHFFRGPRLLQRDPTYRQLLHTRMLSAGAAAAGGFYIALAKTEWDMPDRYAAYFMTAQIITGIVSAVVLGWISDRIGNRLAILISRLVALLSAIAAVVAAAAPPAGEIAVAGHLIPLKYLVLGAAFAGHGFVMYGGQVGEFNYMLDIAPPTRRSLYLGFAGLFLFPVSLAPMALGFLADWVSYAPIFAICSILAVAALVAGWHLEEPREELAQELDMAAK